MSHRAVFADDPGSLVTMTFWDGTEAANAVKADASSSAASAPHAACRLAAPRSAPARPRAGITSTSFARATTTTTASGIASTSVAQVR